MNISYFNTIEDYLDALNEIGKINPIMKFSQYIFPRVLFPIGSILYTLYLFINGESLTTLLLIALTAIVFTLYAYLRLPISIRKRNYNSIHSNAEIKKNVLIERTLILEENRLLLILGDKKVYLEFKDFREVIDRNRRLFIVSNKKKIVFIIPETAFSSNLSKDEFISKLYSIIKK